MTRMIQQILDLTRIRLGGGLSDIDRLSQVVSNLLGNAVQHSPAGAPVH